MSDETHGALAFVTIAPPSPDRANLFSFCFPYETTDYKAIIEPIDMIDVVVPHDEYHDEMDMLGISQFLDAVQCKPFLPWEHFGVSVIKIAKEDQTVPALELLAFVVPTIDMYEGTVSLIEGASNFMDPPFHFTFYRDFSPTLTMFLMIQLWI